MTVNLLTGLLTDTIGFRTSNTSPETLRIAADLVAQGAPLSELYDLAISRMSFVAANYWGHGLSRLQREGNLVWTSLTMEGRSQVGYPGADDADLVNVLMRIEEAEVVVLSSSSTPLKRSKSAGGPTLVWMYRPSLPPLAAVVISPLPGRWWRVH